jgi:hypothetical protein
MAMMKKSKYDRSYRELMVGANQCGNHVEWASELQTETHPSGVGLGGQSDR